MAHDPRVRVGAASILINSENELLLLKRREDASHGQGTWCMPGGWVDFHENPSDTAIRELEEETGLISVADPEFAGITHDVHPEDFSVVCIFFEFQWGHVENLGREFNVEPDKHDDITWWPIPDLRHSVMNGTDNLFGATKSALITLDVFKRQGRKKKP